MHQREHKDQDRPALPLHTVLEPSALRQWTGEV